MKTFSQSLTLPVSQSAPSVRKKARRWAFAWGAFMLALTSWPSPPRVPVVSGIPNFDKLVHFTLYAVEAWLLYRAVRWPGRPGFSAARALAVVGAMAVWGCADETHQTWIPGRSMEGGDVLADVAGAVVGAAAASIGSRRETSLNTGLMGRTGRGGRGKPLRYNALDEMARGIARRFTS